MKYLTFVTSVFLIFFFAYACTSALALDDIENFHSQITVNQDTSLTIIETINYATDLEKHGIFRYIPLMYQQETGNFSRRISQITVTDPNNQPIPFTRSVENRNLVLKIGDPDSTFTGKKTYIIRYRVDDALNQFASHDELFWDITGEGWQIPIQKTKASITSDYASVQDSKCFGGPSGSNDGICTVFHTHNQAQVEYASPISYNDNLTIALKFTKPNDLQFPSSTEKLIKFLTDNWSLILLPFPFLIMCFVWNKYGRDWQFISPNVFNTDPAAPIHKKPLNDYFRVPFVYEPLTEITPGEAGAIVDEKVDNQDVIAEIIDLARKKYLKLEANTKKGFFSNSNDYTFTKLKDNTNELPASQTRLMQDIFKSGDSVTLSSLKGKFYTTMEAVKGIINDHLTQKGLFTTHPTRRRVIGISLSLVLHFIVIKTLIAQLVIVDFFFSAFYPIIFGLFGLGGFISLWLGYNLVQKTALGTNLSLQAKGLKRTIKYGKWREQIKEKNLFIEEVMPYAVALGVIDKLANDMKLLNLKPPQYLSIGYNSSSYNSMNMLSSFSSTASSTLSYNPSSGSSSGGSGFSGGSSGGGGGGGGGGSW